MTQQTERDALRRLAEAASALDHNERLKWYTADELLPSAIYPKNARYMAALPPPIDHASIRPPSTGNDAGELRMTEHFTQADMKELAGDIGISFHPRYFSDKNLTDLCNAAVNHKLKEWEAQGAVAKAVVLTTGIGLQWIGEALPAGTKLYTHDLPAQSAVEQPTEPAPVSQFGSEEMQSLILAKLAAPGTAGERAAFEAWLRSKWTPGYACPKTNDGEYEHGEAQRFWGCWQAALLQSTALPDHSEQHLDMVATPKIGCVQHDCAECQARAALPVGERAWGESSS